MPSFDFIVQSEFRTSLETDYAEMRLCNDAGAWKSVHVIAGSIIEALLIDYLVATKHPSRAKGDPLRLALADAITIAKSEGVLTDRTADLSSVIRSYRNLIHPGRVVRASEAPPSAKSAMIALSLVDMIVDDIAKVRRSTFGLTAEQIVSKVERDSGALGILRLLLKDVHSGEKQRLLLEVLPDRYNTLRLTSFQEEDEETLERLVSAFRMAKETVDGGTRQLLAAKFVQILRQESGYDVGLYRETFFHPSDIEHVEARHQPLVKQHYLTSSDTVHSEASATTYGALAPYVEPSDVARWLDPFVSAIVSTALAVSQRDKVRKTLISACWYGTKGAVDDRIQSRLDVWVNHLNDQKRTEAAADVTRLKDDVIPEFPEFQEEDEA